MVVGDFNRSSCFSLTLSPRDCCNCKCPNVVPLTSLGILRVAVQSCSNSKLVLTFGLHSNVSHFCASNGVVFVELYTCMLHLFSGAFSIPTHGCLVRPIQSAIILLTVHIQSLAPIGSGGCAAVHSLPSVDFRILCFLRKKQIVYVWKTSVSHQIPLSNLHLKPVSLQWNLRHFVARKLLTSAPSGAKPDN